MLERDLSCSFGWSAWIIEAILWMDLVCGTAPPSLLFLLDGHLRGGAVRGRARSWPRADPGL
jgi:hypothetical protein